MFSKPTLLFVNMRRVEKEQIESLLAAKSLGYDIVLLASTMPKILLHHFFQYIEIVDTFDTKTALLAAEKIAKNYNIVGVPSWTEADIELVALISEKLDLPGLPTGVAILARNKYAMKGALVNNPELLPAFRRADDLTSLIDAINIIGLPVVVKPTGASGSKGIFVIDNIQQVPTVLQQLQKITQPSFDPVFRQYGAEFIVEEYLDGNEFSVEGFVVNGQPTIIGITDKWTTDPFYLEYQHIFPSNMPPKILEEIATNTINIIKSLGFNHCAFHLEAKMTSRGFRFIEAAARLGGDYITSHLVRMSTGINMYESLINIAVGKTPILTPKYQAYSGIRFILAPHAGQFVNIEGLENVARHPFIESFILESPLGSQIKMPPQHFGSMRLAACLIKQSTYQQCVATLEEINQFCVPKIQE